ncbi:MAG: hypothetical protein ACYTF5_22385, partial [Planctomycetota bacterium]
MEDAGGWNAEGGQDDDHLAVQADRVLRGAVDAEGQRGKDPALEAAALAGRHDDVLAIGQPDLQHQQHQV